MENKDLNGNFYKATDKDGAEYIDFILRKDDGKRQSQDWALLSFDRATKYYYLNRDRFTKYAQAKMELDILPSLGTLGNETDIGSAKFPRSTFDSRNVPHNNTLGGF